MKTERGEPASGGPFPSSPREIYQNAPLTQVVAQLRFPSLLRIEGTPPADFQDLVRDEFPFVEQGARLALPQGAGGQQIPAEILQILGGQVGGSTYRFLNESRTATITLAPGALTLQADSYTRWEDFLRRLRIPMMALFEIYKPSFVTRVGLRYVNAIEKRRLGFPAETSWTALLRKEMLGELTLPEFENCMSAFASQMQLRLPEQSGQVLFQQAIVTLPGHDEPAYIIDFDFSKVGRTETKDVESILVAFHGLAGNAFRWCIAKRLRDALGPQPVEQP